jgi:hypothetical protein
MIIVGGLDIHRKQLTFDYPGAVTGEVKRGQVAPADRAHLRAWLARFGGRDGVAFVLEGCTGWRYVAGELAAAECGGTSPSGPAPRVPAAASGVPRPARPARHLRQLLAEGRLPECWVPPGHILQCRALLELYRDLRAEHTRVHAVFFRQGAPQLSAGALRTGQGAAAVRAAAVTVAACGEGVRIEVTERSGDGVPVLKPADGGGEAEGSRGLLLVNALAARDDSNRESSCVLGVSLEPVDLGLADPRAYCRLAAATREQISSGNLRQVTEPCSCAVRWPSTSSSILGAADRRRCPAAYQAPSTAAPRRLEAARNTPRR